MPCLASAARALRCLITGTEIARTAGLRVPNVRYATSETSMRLSYISSCILRNQPTYKRRFSSSQLSQVPGFDSALSPVQRPRRRRAPSHRNSIASPEDETSLDQDWLKQTGQSGHPLSGRPEESTREGNPRSSKAAGLSRKAPLYEYSSNTGRGSKRVTRPSRSMKATADFQSGDQNYKDQREPWQTQKRALSDKFGPIGWSPRKRLSPDTLEGIRALHVQYPDKFTTPVLADHFKVSPEAIRRILKSKWRPTIEQEERRRQSWERRGEKIWSQMVEMGIKPPSKWRDRDREKKARIEHTEKSSLLEHSTSNIRTLRTISADGHENGSPVPLADRIL